MLDGEIVKIINKKILLKDLSDAKLLEFCIIANDKYRSGKPIIGDNDYDFIFLAELKKRNIIHPFLTNVEDEKERFGNKLLLPKPMLSTDKAYTFANIEKWLLRINKAADTLGINTGLITIKATPKLDGFAAFDDGNILYTRGNGTKGSDISRVFKRGLSIFAGNKRGLGAGEIVVKKSYFNKYLASHFDSPRNFIASIIKEKELNATIKQVITAKAAVFVPFKVLPQQQITSIDLVKNFNSIVTQMLSVVDFDVDGVIFEAINNKIKDYMGSTRKFHRWQIAFKENKEKAQVKVIDIIPQVGRTGVITPVVKIQPTFISGATISSISYHNYKMLVTSKLGIGSTVELIRSGLVIPKINAVLSTVEQIVVPEKCPSCDNYLSWESDFLVCRANNCQAQISAKLVYFFTTLDNNNGFGPATMNKLYDNGIREITQIYNLTINDFIVMGFGTKTSVNLFNELNKSMATMIEDWRFLAAFGIERLGFGNSEILLKSYKITDIFNLTVKQIAAIDGFGDLGANIIVAGLQNIKTQWDKLYHKFNLEFINNNSQNNYFSNKKIVFSGIMQKSRNIIHKEAKNFGIIIQKSLSAKTDFLVIGDKPGQEKLLRAKKLNINILNEQEYYQQTHRS